MCDEGLIPLGLPCEHCGDPIFSRPKQDGSPRKVRFCLRAECVSKRKIDWQSKADSRGRDRSTSGHRLRGPFACQHCGTEYHTRRRKGEGEKYCSRECSHAAMSATPYCKVSFSQCQECKKPFVTKLGATYCSDDCFREKERKRERARYKAKYKSESRPISCLICSTKFYRLYGRKSKTCSDGCAKLAEQRSARKAKALRRARKKSNGKHELFDPLYVLERDGWRCKCCGVKTPKSKRGLIDDNAPELDHIVPLSCGGEHSRRNTQCLCRKCNQDKSNGAHGDQLLLLG